MKNYNEKLLKLSKHMAKDNIQTARDTATRLTRPSKATRIGSWVGTSLGKGALCVGI
ncbi:hypothetical protein [Gracilibacillus phocaeensis]|uniref:hypothetical protein n=1 Tax=Gracilibacillus phocaeensis TaxID=2042304 RepID=UPI0013EF354B|nr:hypothetical protein [Gracilibacillus phocaeensis]